MKITTEMLEAVHGLAEMSVELYNGLVAKGMQKKEALELTKSFIISTTSQNQTQVTQKEEFLQKLFKTM